MSQFPEGIQPLHRFIQPYFKEKIDPAAVPSFTPEQRIFWAQTVFAIDERLADLADQNSEVIGWVKDWRQTAKVQIRMRKTLLDLLKKDREDTDHLQRRLVVVSVMEGTVPELINMQQRFNEEGLSDRLSTVLIGGTNGNGVGKTTLLTEVNRDVLGSPLLVLHDDIADTLGVLAVMVNARSLPTAERRVCEALIDRLAGSFGKDFENYVDDYVKLVGLMRNAGVLAAIPFYKNAPFLRVLRESVDEILQKKESDEWALAQQALLNSSVEVPNEWLMGEGLDTAIDGNLLLSEIYERLEGGVPMDLQLLLFPLASCKVRVGATIQGLIALKNNDFNALLDVVSEVLLEEYKDLAEVDGVEVGKFGDAGV